MTSYGGYQRTGYGTQGGEDGGGFMGGSQQGSQGERKSYADDSLRPVTIKQLIECKEAYPGADLAVDGVPTTQVTLVGQVRSVNPQAVNVTYRIDDGTGVIDVKKWIDADKADNTPRFAPDTYVRVFGRLSSFNGRKHVGAHYIRAIDDFNEVNYHLLEATYVHLCLTKGGLADLQQQQQQQQQQQGEESEPEEQEEVLEDKDAEKEARTPHGGGDSSEATAAEEEPDQPTYAPIGARGSRPSSQLSRARSRASSVAARSLYEGNPYDIDRVNTRNSFA